MQLIITPGGVIRCLYCETLDLRALGRPAITRASRVEPTSSGAWIADLSPVDGPTLGPFPKRSEALAAEVAWLERHLLSPAIPETPHGLSETVPRSAAVGGWRDSVPG